MTPPHRRVTASEMANSLPAEMTKSLATKIAKSLAADGEKFSSKSLAARIVSNLAAKTVRSWLLKWRII